MSVRNGFVLLLALSALTFLVACGGSSNNITTGVAPPTGGFTNANLSGTYVFSISGIDLQGDPVSMVGTLIANGSGGNGKGGITGGTIDINDAAATPVANAPINNNGNYSIGADGRGQATIGVPANPINGDNITFDFVLQNSSHGLITGFNGDYTGSGTIDLQSSPAASGNYAFILSGFDASNAFASIGNFTLGAGGAITTGLADFNDGGFPYADQSLSGGVVLGPSATPGTTLITPQFGTQTYDVYGIDSTHLKFIEMDPGVTLAGDAYSQSSTSMPVGTLPFTISGSYPGPSTFSVAGGFIVTDASGDITSASTEDANNSGTVSPSPITFSGTYVAAGTGRFTLGLSGFSDGIEYAAYPSSAGVLLLEIDSATSSIMSGVAYPPQSSTTFSTSEGYALNLTGANLTNGVEVDDIAEFTADSTGTTVTGVIDENYQPNSTGVIYGVALSGTYTAPDSNGRGQIGATAANGSNSTINGGLGLTFYAVDGTTFPFIETDANGQITSGVFVQQSSTAGAAVAKPHNMFVPHPLIRPHTKQKQEGK